ncbi:MAG: TonB-dependent receptor [Brevundimonas sp.]|nr:TonB-dependent receptor [Brevundimonas sp.]
MNSKDIGKLCLVAVCAATPVQTAAQDASTPTIVDEIVVTAQRRVQPLADVPVSITAVSGDRLVQALVRDTGDLTALAPGLTGKPQGLGTPVFSIRGISTNSVGIGGESSVGVFWDEGYLGRLESSNIPFFDVAQIDVLKGPQSTLFGRNVSAGVISVTSRRPTSNTAADFTASYASFDSFEASGGLTIPATDSLSFRVAGLYRDRGGMERNVLLDRLEGGGRTTALRGIALFEPSSSFTLTAILNHVQDQGGGFPSQALDPALSDAGGLASDPFDGRHATNVQTFEKRNLWSANVQSEWNISENLTFKSITTALDTTLDRQFDADGSAAPLLDAHFRNYRNRTFGQEVRLLGRAGNLEWFFGASIFEEWIRQNVDFTYSEFAILSGVQVAPDTLFPGQAAFAICDEPLTTIGLGVPCSPEVVETISGRGRNSNYSLFADATYQFTNEVRMTGGVRVSQDRKHFNYNVPTIISVSSSLNGANLFSAATDGPRNFEQSWNSVQPRIVLDYKPSEQTILFASASRGFKAGGFDPAVEVSRVPFDQEGVWAYEAGTRFRSPDHRLNIGFSAYYLDYSGYQLQVLRNGTTSTLNAPSARSYGAEFEGAWRPYSWASFDLNLAYNDSTFLDLVTDAGSLRGNRLLYAPEVTAYAAASFDVYRTDRAIGSLRLSARHESRQFFTKENLIEESQEAYTVIDVSATLQIRPSDFEFRIFARNLLNERYLTYAVDQGFGVVTNRGEPRIVGIQALWSL